MKRFYSVAILLNVGIFISFGDRSRLKKKGYKCDLLIGQSDDLLPLCMSHDVIDVTLHFIQEVCRCHAL